VVEQMKQQPAFGLLLIAFQVENVLRRGDELGAIVTTATFDEAALMYIVDATLRLDLSHPCVRWDPGELIRDAINPAVVPMLHAFDNPQRRYAEFDKILRSDLQQVLGNSWIQFTKAFPWQARCARNAIVHGAAAQRGDSSFKFVRQKLRSNNIWRKTLPGANERGFSFLGQPIIINLLNAAKLKDVAGQYRTLVDAIHNDLDACSF